MFKLDTDLKLPSNRNFGLLFVFIFSLISIHGYLNGSKYLYLALAILIIVLFATIFTPSKLEPINKAWQFLGIMLGKITSPIFLGIIYFAIITPIGLISRFFGRDVLRIKSSRGLKSYWVVRESGDDNTSSFRDQF